MNPNGEIARFIHRKIREYNEEALTKKQIAQRLGVDRRTIYNYEQREENGSRF